MRLLYLSGSGAMGGAERVLLDVILGMQARGHQIKLILGEHGPLQSQVAGAGVEAEVLPMPERLAAFGESGQSPAAMLAGVPAAGAAALCVPPRAQRVCRPVEPVADPQQRHQDTCARRQAPSFRAARLASARLRRVTSADCQAAAMAARRGTGSDRQFRQRGHRREGDAAGPADLDGAKRGSARSVSARRGPGGSRRAEPPRFAAARNDSRWPDCDLRVVERPRRVPPRAGQSASVAGGSRLHRRRRDLSKRPPTGDGR